MPSVATLFESRRFGVLTVIRLLGSGAEGNVWLTANESGVEYAVKEYLTSRSRGGRNMYMSREMAAQTTLGEHPNILRMLDTAMRLSICSLTKDDLRARVRMSTAVVYPYYPMGDMVDFSERRYSLPSSESIDGARLAMRGLWRAIEHCHSRNICHRDVKPQNILFDHWNDSVVLSDFGLSTGRTGITNPGTSLIYSAPECPATTRCKLEPYDSKCDIWSAGAVEAAMLWGDKIIYSGERGAKFRKKGYRYFVTEHPRLWNALPSSSKQVLASSLIPSPKHRATAGEIVRMMA